MLWPALLLIGVRTQFAVGRLVAKYNENKEMPRQTQKATRVKEDSRRAGMAHEELQEMADDKQKWKERAIVRRGG